MDINNYKGLFDFKLYEGRELECGDVLKLDDESLRLVGDNVSQVYHHEMFIKDRTIWAIANIEQIFPSRRINDTTG